MRKQKYAAESGFDRYDKGRLQRALQKVSEKRIFLRLQAVLLVAQGMSIDSVIMVTNKSRRIIYYWISSYIKTHQPTCLYDAPRQGRPPAAPAITNNRIMKALKSNPLELGYNTNVWTVATLSKHLSQRYECEIAPFTLYRRMRQMGLRCKRPRYVYSEKDPNRAQKKGP